VSPGVLVESLTKEYFTAASYCALLVHEVSPNTTLYNCINPLNTEFLQNFISKFNSYLTGNRLRLHYKGQPGNAV
jgi:hypothetical protein